MNSHPCRPSRFLAPAAGLALLGLAGCLTDRFVASYYLDPKPPRVAYEDLKRSEHPEPVYLVFDMYAAGGAYPDATRKLGPKVARVVESSRLFSTVAKVGSENMARLQVAMKETAVLTGKETRVLPEGLTSRLTGSKAAVAYEFSASYHAPGVQPVRKTYPHAVHLVEGGGPELAEATPMTAAHAVDLMVEQVVLRFLRDLQTSGALR